MKLTLHQLAHGAGLKLEVRDRGFSADPRFYAYFKEMFLKEAGACLIGAIGNGNTEQEALDNYAKRIQKRTLTTVDGSFTLNVGPLATAAEDEQQISLSQALVKIREIADGRRHYEDGGWGALGEIRDIANEALKET